MPHAIRQLDASTWDAFAELVERDDGVYGGCWCIGYHPKAAERGVSYRAVKEERVRTGRAHAALVIDEKCPPRAGANTGVPRSSLASSASASTTRIAPLRWTGESLASS